MMRRVVAVFLVLLASGACAFHSLTLSRKALGCYHVAADGWTPEIAGVVGFDELPSVIALDSALQQSGRRPEERTVLVPRNWRLRGARENHAGWSNSVRSDWRLLPGDTVIFVRGGSRMHEMAGDSIVVTWWGWGGAVDAYLARTQYGYAGIGQVEPRPLAKGTDPVMIHLRRTSCDEWSGRLVPSGASQHASGAGTRGGNR
jgi:hypothetical protein